MHSAMLHHADEHTFESFVVIHDSRVSADETCPPDHSMPGLKHRHALDHEECENYPEVQ